MLLLIITTCDGCTLEPFLELMPAAGVAAENWRSYPCQLNPYARLGRDWIGCLTVHH